MPLVMKKKGKRTDTPTRLDEEHTQSVFMSWCTVDETETEVMQRVARRHRAKLTPLRHQATSVDDAATDEDEVTREVAEEAIARNLAAWHKPADLLAALTSFRRCLDRPGIDELLAPTGHDVDAHREVTDDLIRRVTWAQQKGADEVCLEGDPFLL